jgi:prepilin-type N-terminal cleavage/methylation domain-containing protein
MKAVIRRQAGDTIVEVIVVLAVLGLAVSTAYATANRSLLATRQAEENSQATEILQSQFETLRSYAANTTGPMNIYQSGAGFCVAEDGSIVTSALLSPDKTANPSLYASGCYQNNLFYIAVFYDASTQDTFTAKATWDDVTGSGQDTVTLVDRLHPPL